MISSDSGVDTATPAEHHLECGLMLAEPCFMDNDDYPCPIRRKMLSHNTIWCANRHSDVLIAASNRQSPGRGRGLQSGDPFQAGPGHLCAPVGHWRRVSRVSGGPTNSRADQPSRAQIGCSRATLRRDQQPGAQKMWASRHLTPQTYIKQGDQTGDSDVVE
jgi:hypothetical protein